MDSAARVSATVVDPLTVGKAFVTQYYYILYDMPELLPRFYHDISKVGRVGEDGVMSKFSTLQGIREGLKTLSYGDFKEAEIISYDAQESYNGGIFLVVTGYFTLTERLRRKFTQTFFLAPQENGYFVLNDMLRFVNAPEEVISVKDSEPHSPVTAPAGNKGSEQAAYVCEEVSKPLNNGSASVANENVLVSKIINEEVPGVGSTCKEVADCSMKISDSDDGHGDVTKKSYASALKVTKDKAGVSAVSSLSAKQIHNVQEHQASLDPFPEQIVKDQGYQASSDPSPVIESVAVSETVDATANGHNQESEAVAEGTSIYVKHLPPNATIDMLEAEFKKFGAITNGGIQVINQRGVGFPYGFVEFEEADAAQKAIEASPLRIDGQRAYVEEKRSTLRGNRGNGNRRGSYGNGDYYRRGGRGGGRFYNRRGNEQFGRFNTY